MGNGANGTGPELLGERYRLVEQLGAGGMSVVWRGYDEVLGRQVAVKVLAAGHADDRSFRHRIRTEAKAAARLLHPNITNVYDYGESIRGGVTVPYVVMELVDGESLQSWLRRNRRMTWRDAATVAMEVASALATAHARGLVHRDVTPGNVMLTPAGAKVVDFGISAVAGENESGPDGSLYGTPAYLAPERLDGGQVRPAADVYALGLVLYRMLAGRLPWQASSTTEMLRAHLYQEPEPLPPMDDLPEELAGLCRRCLAKDPAERPTSAELARSLAEALGLPAVLPVSPAPMGVTSGDDTDPDVLAHAGTTILPWSAATDAIHLPGSARVPARGRAARRNAARHGATSGAGGAWRGSSRRRRAEVAAVSVGLITVTGVIWAATSHTPASGGDDRAADMSLRESACQVDYRLRKDSGNSFDADLTVTNTGVRAVRDWELRFAFPGDQSVTNGRSVDVVQQGPEVVLHPGERNLAPGESAVLGLTGRYAAGNPLPVKFAIGDATCDVRVTGIAGQPVPTTGPTTSGSGGPTKATGSQRTTTTVTGNGRSGGKAKGGKSGKSGGEESGKSDGKSDRGGKSDGGKSDGGRDRSAGGGTGKSKK